MLLKNIVISLLIAMSANVVVAVEDAATPFQNRYKNTIFVANSASFKPNVVTDPRFVNAWGIAIRPKGAGGHFWVTAKDISYEYVGDVSASPDEKLRSLHQDTLAEVKLPVGGKENTATGVVFNDGKEGFVIQQNVKNADPITAPAKFLFASDGGIISAWTERKKPDGTFDRPLDAVKVIDASKEGSQFFGLTMNASYTRLYAADFGKAPAIRVFNNRFQPEAITFDAPFDTNKNGKVDAGEYAPFNVQALTTPQGESNIFVAYAMTQSCPAKEIKAGVCKAGEVFAGEEDTSKTSLGRLAEFDEDGKLIRIWQDGGRLSAPWGMAFAPANFGAMSGKLLVGNFGDGTIAAFDATTHKFDDFVKDDQSQIIKIEKLWGLLFGNGESLGDANTLYYAAGPKDEKDGIFGSLRFVK